MKKDTRGGIKYISTLSGSILSNQEQSQAKSSIKNKPSRWNREDYK